jgi:hypothetical protein
LKYVMPGDVGYVVSGPDSAADGSDDPDDPAAKPPISDRPWYTDLWRSAQMAADPSDPGQRAGSR